MITVANKEETIHFIHDNGTYIAWEASKKVPNDKASQVMEAMNDMLALGEDTETWTKLITAIDNYKQHRAAKNIVSRKETEGDS